MDKEKKMKQVSTAPMGKKREKKMKQVSKAPMGKERLNAGIRGPDGPRNTFSC